MTPGTASSSESAIKHSATRTNYPLSRCMDPPDAQYSTSPNERVGEKRVQQCESETKDKHLSHGTAGPPSLPGQFCTFRSYSSSSVRGKHNLLVHSPLSAMFSGPNTQLVRCKVIHYRKRHSVFLLLLRHQMGNLMTRSIHPNRKKRSKHSKVTYTFMLLLVLLSC